MLASIADLVSLGSSRLLSLPLGATRWPSEGPITLDQPSSRARVVSLLYEHGALGGQFHVLSRDPWRFVASADGRALMPYQERAFALVGWRDPIGPENARGGALGGFRRRAERLGKHAGILGASDALTDHAKANGYGATWIGAEPFYDLASWNLRGKRGEKLRLAINHAKRVGAVARELFPLEVARDRAEIARVERAWKAARPARENPSFLRTEPLENAEHRRFFGVESRGAGEARLESFLVCSPLDRRGFYLQDLVRHPSAPRGATELVTVHAMDRLREDGAEQVSMGVVALFDPRGSNTASPAARWTLSHFDRLYRFSGLKQFRAKFVPTRSEGVHVLSWPRLLTPLAIWNIASVLSGRSRAH